MDCSLTHAEPTRPRLPRLTPTGCWALLIASALLVGGCTGWALQPARAAEAPRWGLSPTPSPAPTWTPAGADAQETPPAAPHAAVSAPEPAATPTATRYAPASRGGRDGDAVERWRDLVAQYDWPVDRALAVIRCESRGQNVPNAQGSGAAGLFQLLGWEWKARELYGPDASVWDPAVNVGVAHWLWRAGGRRFGSAIGWAASAGCWG